MLVEIAVKAATSTVLVNSHTEKYNFLGISIVGQSNERGDGGIYIGSIMKGGAVAADGRIEPGDMLLQVRRAWNSGSVHLSNHCLVEWYLWSTTEATSWGPFQFSNFGSVVWLWLFYFGMFRKIKVCPYSVYGCHVAYNTFLLPRWMTSTLRTWAMMTQCGYWERLYTSQGELLLPFWMSWNIWLFHWLIVFLLLFARPIILTVAKCWDPSPQGYFTLPRSERCTFTLLCCWSQFT